MAIVGRHPEDVTDEAGRFAREGGSEHHQIEVAAYFIAEHRGFAPGHELDDWLEAEREFGVLIASYGED
jgi:hypothetical protein